jgi:hypothetical protein
MNDYTKQERRFTTSQCARLLGLSVRELEQLERLGVGPDYEGTLPYFLPPQEDRAMDFSTCARSNPVV